MRFLLPILLALLLPTTAAFAQIPKVSLTTKLVDTLPKPTNEERRESRDKKKNVVAEKERQMVSAAIRNVSRQEFPGAVAKFYFFGRTVGEPSLQLLDQDEKPAAIGAGATVTVESKSVEATYTPTHTTKEGDKSVHFKAAGTRITGHGVRVMDGDVLLGEFFTSTDGKTLADGKGPPAGAPAATNTH